MTNRREKRAARFAKLNTSNSMSPLSIKPYANAQPNEGLEQQQQPKVAEDIYVRGEIIANVSEDSIRKYVTEKNKETPRENYRFFIECATLGFVCLVALLTVIQTCKVSDSAKAAQDAADVARDTLHISQRAYLAVVGASPDYANSRVSFSVTNNGHIPAGKVTTIVHVDMFTMKTPGDIANKSEDRPYYPFWAELDESDVAVGDSGTFDVAMPGLNKDLIESGHQAYFVVGDITYEDGFPNTPTDHSRFCFSAAFNPFLKTDSATVLKCNADIYLRSAIINDRYPSVEHKRDH